MSAPSKPGALDALDTLERRLLDAARLERPDSSARQRALLALAGGAVLGSATGTSAAATMSGAGSAVSTGAISASGGAKVLLGATTLAAVTKAVAVGAISGAVVLGAAQRIQRPEPARAVPASAAEFERPAPRNAERSGPSSAVNTALPRAGNREIALPPIEVPVERPVAAPARRAEKDAPPKADSPPLPGRVESAEVAAGAGDTHETFSLAEEVTLLDRARDALVTGDPRRALVILDSYERAKIGTTLSAEAALLRIEALVLRGESGRAAALAAEFLRAHPQSPVADRLLSIMQAAPR